jgi:hypothetical protein
MSKSQKWPFLEDKKVMVTKNGPYFLEMRALCSQVGFREFFFKLKNLFLKMDKYLSNFHLSFFNLKFFSFLKIGP